MAEPQNSTAAHKRRRRLLRNYGIGAAVLVAIIALVVARREKPKLPPGLVTDEAKRVDLVQTVSATGSVAAQTGAMVRIGSQITGRIKHLSADVGTPMRAGEVIAELDVPDLRAQVRQAEATLALNQKRLSEQLAGVELQRTQSRSAIETANAAVATAQANLRQAEQSAELQVPAAEAQVQQAQANAVNSAANLRRQQELYQKDYVAASDVDNARAQSEVNAAQLAGAQKSLELTKATVATALASAREALKQAQATAAAAQAGTAQNAVKQAQVAEAREQVRQSTAQLDLASSQLDKAFIRTPISGTVLQLAQQEGETIAAGLSAPTLIIVADLNRLQVEAFVDETDIGKVTLGQPAQVTVDAYPDRTFPGVVAKIASGATMQQNVVTYDVTIALQHPKGLLKPDMTATVNIEVARRKSVLTVPVDAIKPGAQGNTVTVMTTDKKGMPHFKVVSVTTGISDGENTEILSGLKEGDTVVLSGEVPGMTTEAGGPRFGGMFGFGRRGGGGARGGGGGRGGGPGGR
jgi:RND family efflux transporter MFP subunit